MGNGPKNMGQFKKVVNDRDPGEYWGMEFPFTPQMLRDMGPEWLTKAMHTTGVLPKDNEITEFVDMDVKAEDVTKQDAENAKWGGAGLKILLSVKYRNGPGDLSEHMFLKMPHEFTGKNERFKNSVSNGGMMDWNEVTFYNILGGRFGDLPFKTPRMYFCDMCRKTTNFVNIVERIPYAPDGKFEVGPGEYFPAPGKYRDWALPNNGVDFYYAHARTLAQFFAWHNVTRRKTDQIEKTFMDEGTMGLRTSIYSMVGKAGPYNSSQRDEGFMQMLKDPQIVGLVPSYGFPESSALGFLGIAEEFIKQMAPHCFAKEFTAPKFMDNFVTQAKEMSKYLCEMGFYSNAIPEFFSLVHPNAQVDNAFYWLNPTGDMECGLLDWGGVSHGCIPACIGNGWMGAEPLVMDEHEEKLVRLFIDEYEKIAGFRFDFDDLYMHIKMSQACVFYGCCANLGMLLRIIPRAEWKNVKNRYDKRIDDNFLIRCYFVQVEMYLGMWKKRSPYAAFQQWQKRLNFPKK